MKKLFTLCVLCCCGYCFADETPAEKLASIVEGGTEITQTIDTPVPADDQSASVPVPAIEEVAVENTETAEEPVKEDTVKQECVNCANGNCPNGNCPNGNCFNGNCFNGNCANGNCANGNCWMRGNCPNGNCGNQKYQYRLVCNGLFCYYTYVPVQNPAPAENQNNESTEEPAKTEEPANLDEIPEFKEPEMIPIDFELPECEPTEDCAQCVENVFDTEEIGCFNKLCALFGRPFEVSFDHIPACRAWSSNMAQSGSIFHAPGFMECVAMGYGGEGTAIQWFNSPSHRSIIQGAKGIAIGRFGMFWTLRVIY